MPFRNESLCGCERIKILILWQIGYVLYSFQKAQNKVINGAQSQLL